MPFKSEEQRTWLKHNRPDIYRDWMKKYGSEIETSKMEKKKRFKKYKSKNPKRKSFKKEEW